MRNLITAVTVVLMSMSFAACGGKSDSGQAKKKCGEIHSRAFKKDAPFMNIGLMYKSDQPGFVEMCSSGDSWKVYKHVHATCLPKSDKDMGDCVEDMFSKHRS